VTIALPADVFEFLAELAEEGADECIAFIVTAERTSMM
jgi:hypothetical protein